MRIRHDLAKPGLVLIDVPEAVLDPEVTVVAVRLKGPVALYRR